MTALGRTDPPDGAAITDRAWDVPFSSTEGSAQGAERRAETHFDVTPCFGHEGKPVGPSAYPVNPKSDPARHAAAWHTV
jgi:hypothetical protein